MASNHWTIPQAWAEGRPASAGALHTDGNRIYSYGLCIGYTKDGRKIGINVHSSVTTGRHRNGVKAVADEMVTIEGHKQYTCHEYCEHIPS